MEIKCNRSGCANHEGTERLSIASCSLKTIEIDQYGNCKSRVDWGFTKKMEILKATIPPEPIRITPIDDDRCKDCALVPETDECIESRITFEHQCGVKEGGV